MPVAPSVFSRTLTRILCIVVIAIIVIAAAYATWVGVSNFARISV